MSELRDPGLAWAALTTTALRGTERAAGGAVALPEPLAALCKSDADAEAQLLRAIALLAPLLRAGQVPNKSTGPLPPEAAPDMQPQAGPLASHALTVILGAEQPDLLREWCHTAGAAQRRVPEHLLPAFLDALIAPANAAVAPAMRGVLGMRGAWLAQLNPAWRGALAVSVPDSDEVWHTGSRPERIALLRARRSRDPDAARALLKQTLASEQPDDLAAFLECLTVGLSMADHELLEGLLDAKHKSVRTGSARLLTALPQSARAARMVERVQPLLTFTPPQAGLLRKRKAELVVQLPEACDKAMTRDGIDANRKRGKLGPKAMMLVQLLAATPLVWFTRTWNTDPRTILDAARAGEWAEACLLGWSEACLLQRDAAWAEAVLACYSEAAPTILESLDWDTLPRLFALLDRTQGESFMTALLERRGVAVHDDWVLRGLDSMDDAWSEAFSRSFWKVALRNYFVAYRYPLRGLLPKLAARTPVAVAAESLRDWPTTSKDWEPADQRALDEITSQVELRKTYLKELRS